MGTMLTLKCTSGSTQFGTQLRVIVLLLWDVKVKHEQASVCLCQFSSVSCVCFFSPTLRQKH